MPGRPTHPAGPDQTTIDPEHLVEATAPPPSRPPRALTRRFRGPFARWPRMADATLAVLLFTFTVLLVDGPGDTMVTRDPSQVPLPVLGVFAIANVAIYWRRQYPLRVVGVALLSMAVLLGSGFADTGGALIVALHSVGRYSDADLWGEASAAAAAVLALLDGVTTDVPWGEVALAVVVMVGAWYFGRSRRLRAERVAQYLREQEAERRRVIAEERTRIARELHDVVAHRVSLMTVQAGAAATVAEHDPAAAQRAMRAVEEAGRQALDELRHLLGVLRPEVDGAARDPQPGLADLPRLVDHVRGAGIEVALDVTDVPDDLPARIELSAYRIIQEALTNVLKHADDSARAEVIVRGTVDGPHATHALHVEIRDDGGRSRGRGDPSEATGATGGHGILGMRERALLLGGRLEAGPTPDGGFLVTADLPARTHDEHLAEEAPT